ncbi:hypothetical protein ACQYWQ_09500 [Streptomyces sp. P6-2-1]|uniref:hypothetical protein n=1 Tax=Streptomyces sp. P6-2-1 TaxID=3422591 RepID=UPI003D3700F3
MRTTRTTRASSGDGVPERARTRARRWLALLAGAGLVGAGVTGCAGAPAPQPVAAEVSASPYRFLEPGTCSGGERADGRKATVREVSCRSESAVARVLTRHEERRADGPLCPGRTDFVLQLSGGDPGLDEDGDGSVARGYACMRNLEAPHPGDPGQGGGPRTVAGDCVRAIGEGEVRETACAARGAERPEHRVVTTVRERARCPEGTELYVTVGGKRPVGCGVPVRGGGA